MSSEKYLALLPYALSDTQAKVINWLIDHPEATQTACAGALGMGKGTANTAVSRVKRRAAAKDSAQHTAKAPPGYKLRGVSTLLDSAGQVKSQWVKTAPDNDNLVQTVEAIRAEVAELDVPRLEAAQAPEHTLAELCAVYPMGDPHLGMRAWDHETGANFDLAIAKRNLLEAHQRLVSMAPPAKRAIVATLGDTFHADNNSNRTPKSGHGLDVDGRHELTARVAFYSFRTCVQLALERHEVVDVIVTRGNHDPESSLWLKLMLEAIFESEPRVTVHASSDYYDYLQHGKCLFGFHHGDGAKASALGEVMAHDKPALWGETTHRHWYTGHVHHETYKELRGCTVETVNTLASRDAWHHHAGYRSKRRALVDVWHAEHGHISRQRWTVA